MYQNATNVYADIMLFPYLGYAKYVLYQVFSIYIRYFVVKTIKYGAFNVNV